MVVRDENSDLCLSHKNKVFWFEKASNLFLGTKNSGFW